MSIEKSEGLSIIDKLLPVWIGIAMVIGFVFSYFEGITEFFELVQIGSVSLPIAIGLLWMMYPVLAKVKYEELGKITGMKRIFGVSLFLNWIIGPILMFSLAWIFLPTQTAFREGIILVGLARCIAMVLIWNMLAGGDGELCAVLVALNSIFQIFFYSIYAWFFMDFLSETIFGEGTSINISIFDIAISVFIFLGIPMLGGIITRIIGIKKKGKEWYDSTFAPKLGPYALIGLLFTIIVMFSMQGQNILDKGVELVAVITTLFIYFILMFLISFFISWMLGFIYRNTVTLSFTAASNNFELAIAVAIATFTIESDQALATVIGPLIEVPVLVALVYVSLWLKSRLFTAKGISKFREST
ncbi:MAG: ACR3 family arsenite efflux transporter [Candidatus Hodarchaeota archaeon]